MEVLVKSLFGTEPTIIDIPPLYEDYLSIRLGLLLYMPKVSYRVYRKEVETSCRPHLPAGNSGFY